MPRPCPRPRPCRAPAAACLAVACLAAVPLLLAAALAAAVPPLPAELRAARAPGGEGPRGAVPPGRVVYATFRPGNLDVYHVPGPGSEPRRLTEHPGLDYDPALSPDGRWVVFTSERRGSPDLFVLDLRDGGAPRLLVDSPAMEDQAAFAPDGRTLYFVGSATGDAEVYRIPFTPERTRSMDGAVNLTHHPAGDFRPAASPDGRRVAFSSDRAHPPSNDNPIARLRGGDVYLVSPDGSGLRRLTESPGWAGSPAWSPDGETVYFYRRQGQVLGELEFGLWKTGTDGSGSEEIVEGDPAVLAPAVRPDGRVLYLAGTAAARRRTGEFAVWSAGPGGEDPRLVTDALRAFGPPAVAARGEGFVAHGPGPVDGDAPAGGASGLLGPGPLRPASAPFTRRLPDRTLELHPVREIMASVLPSGDSVLRTPPPGPRLVVSALDGSGAREVIPLDPGFPARGVTPSPDGRWFLYMKGRMFGSPDSEADLWRVRPDGTGAENLTPDTPGNDGFASFAGDGSWLAFRSGRTGDFDIFRMDADGGHPRNLTDHPARDVFPAVSPDGDRIVFLSDRDSPEARLYDLYVMELGPDGSPTGIRRLTDNDVQEGHPYFSPDGEWVVFTSEMGGVNDEDPIVQSYRFSPQPYGELYALRLDDGRLVRLTHDKWEDGFPTWVAAPGTPAGSSAGGGAADTVRQSPGNATGRGPSAWEAEEPARRRWAGCLPGARPGRGGSREPPPHGALISWRRHSLSSAPPWVSGGRPGPASRVKTPHRSTSPTCSPPRRTGRLSVKRSWVGSSPSAQAPGRPRSRGAPPANLAPNRHTSTASSSGSTIQYSRTPRRR